MMKFAWLDEMVDRGEIRAEALPYIYEKCAATLNELGHEKAAGIGEAAGKILQMLGFMVVPTVVGAGAQMAMESIRTRALDASTVETARQNKKEVLASLPQADRQKAEARILEVMKYAPSLAANKAVLAKIISEKIHSGFTSQDVQNLVAIQSTLTPDAGRYSDLTNRLSGQGKIASEESALEGVNEDLAGDDFDTEKQAAALEFCGEKLAEIYCAFSKEASALPSWRDVGGHLLRTISVPLALTAGITGASYVKKKIDEKALRTQLEQSFNVALSNDEKLQAEKERARAAFQTLTHFAPHVASEPSAARAFMRRMVDYSGLSPQSGDIKDLTEIERNMRGSGGGLLDTFGQSAQISGLGTGITRAWGSALAPYDKAYQARMEPSLDIHKPEKGRGE